MVLVEEVVEEYQAKIVTLRMGVDNQIPLSDESGCSYPAIQIIQQLLATLLNAE